ncbi:hypothetical protein B0H16DRAFT_1727379 [Mycena metata]|uniref:Uncharacterized protein n=1 Tax=Mycena metata TaxID=1033252 RepID=A0AAD7IIU3_9AGAR|nr:hypothetical protein B0H16DRAFT_1727379 [Mycena metata]
MTEILDEAPETDDEPVFPPDIELLVVVEAVERVLQSKSNAFLANAIRHILYTVPLAHWSNAKTSDVFSTILDIDPDIFELAIKKYSSFVSTSRSIPADIRPQRLMVQFNRDAGPKASHAESWEQWSPLTTLPALTHLGFTENIATGILPQVLTELSNLRALVTIWQTDASARSKSRVDAFSRGIATPDLRIVLTLVPAFYEDWERGAWSGDDLWKRIDDFIARKRRGEIQASDYILNPKELSG